MFAFLDLLEKQNKTTPPKKTKNNQNQKPEHFHYAEIKEESEGTFKIHQCQSVSVLKALLLMLVSTIVSLYFSLTSCYSIVVL